MTDEWDDYLQNYSAIKKGTTSVSDQINVLSAQVAEILQALEGLDEIKQALAGGMQGAGQPAAGMPPMGGAMPGNAPTMPVQASAKKKVIRSKSAIVKDATEKAVGFQTSPQEKAGAAMSDTCRILENAAEEALGKGDKDTAEALGRLITKINGTSYQSNVKKKIKKSDDSVNLESEAKLGGTDRTVENVISANVKRAQHVRSGLYASEYILDMFRRADALARYKTRDENGLFEPVGYTKGPGNTQVPNNRVSRAMDRLGRVMLADNPVYIAYTKDPSVLPATGDVGVNDEDVAQFEAWLALDKAVSSQYSPTNLEMERFCNAFTPVMTEVKETYADGNVDDRFDDYFSGEAGANSFKDFKNETQKTRNAVKNSMEGRRKEYVIGGQLKIADGMIPENTFKPAVMKKKAGNDAVYAKALGDKLLDQGMVSSFCDYAVEIIATDAKGRLERQRPKLESIDYGDTQFNAFNAASFMVDEQVDRLQYCLNKIKRSGNYAALVQFAVDARNTLDKITTDMKTYGNSRGNSDGLQQKAELAGATEDTGILPDITAYTLDLARKANDTMKVARGLSRAKPGTFMKNNMFRRFFSTKDPSLETLMSAFYNQGTYELSLLKEQNQSRIRAPSKAPLLETPDSVESGDQEYTDEAHPEESATEGEGYGLVGEELQEANDVPETALGDRGAIDLDKGNEVDAGNQGLKGVTAGFKPIEYSDIVPQVTDGNWDTANFGGRNEIYVSDEDYKKGLDEYNYGDGGSTKWRLVRNPDYSDPKSDDPRKANPWKYIWYNRPGMPREAYDVNDAGWKEYAEAIGLPTAGSIGHDSPVETTSIPGQEGVSLIYPMSDPAEAETEKAETMLIGLLKQTQMKLLKAALIPAGNALDGMRLKYHKQKGLDEGGEQSIASAYKPILKDLDALFEHMRTGRSAKTVEGDVTKLSADYAGITDSDVRAEVDKVFEIAKFSPAPVGEAYHGAAMTVTELPTIFAKGLSLEGMSSINGIQGDIETNAAKASGANEFLQASVTKPLEEIRAKIQAEQDAIKNYLESADPSVKGNFDEALRIESDAIHSIQNAIDLLGTTMVGVEDTKFGPTLTRSSASRPYESGTRYLSRNSITQLKQVGEKILASAFEHGVGYSPEISDLKDLMMEINQRGSCEEGEMDRVLGNIEDLAQSNGLDASKWSELGDVMNLLNEYYEFNAGGVATLSKVEALDEATKEIGELIANPVFKKFATPLANIQKELSARLPELKSVYSVIDNGTALGQIPWIEAVKDKFVERATKELSELDLGKIRDNAAMEGPKIRAKLVHVIADDLNIPVEAADLMTSEWSTSDLAKLEKAASLKLYSNAIEKYADNPVYIDAYTEKLEELQGAGMEQAEAEQLAAQAGYVAVVGTLREFDHPFTTKAAKEDQPALVPGLARFILDDALLGKNRLMDDTGKDLASDEVRDRAVVKMMAVIGKSPVDVLYDQCGTEIDQGTTDLVAKLKSDVKADRELIKKAMTVGAVESILGQCSLNGAPMFTSDEIHAICSKFPEGGSVLDNTDGAKKLVAPYITRKFRLAEQEAKFNGVKTAMTGLSADGKDPRKVYFDSIPAESAKDFNKSARHGLGDSTALRMVMAKSGVTEKILKDSQLDELIEKSTAVAEKIAELRQVIDQKDADIEGDADKEGVRDIGSTESERATLDEAIEEYSNITSQLQALCTEEDKARLGADFSNPVKVAKILAKSRSANMSAFGEAVLQYYGSALYQVGMTHPEWLKEGGKFQDYQELCEDILPSVQGDALDAEKSRTISSKAIRAAKKSDDVDATRFANSRKAGNIASVDENGDIKEMDEYQAGEWTRALADPKYDEKRFKRFTDEVEDRDMSEEDMSTDIIYAGWNEGDAIERNCGRAVKLVDDVVKAGGRFGIDGKLDLASIQDPAVRSECEDLADFMHPNQMDDAYNWYLYQTSEDEGVKAGAFDSLSDEFKRAMGQGWAVKHGLFNNMITVGQLDYADKNTIAPADMLSLFSGEPAKDMAAVGSAVKESLSKGELLTGKLKEIAEKGQNYSRMMDARTQQAETLGQIRGKKRKWYTKELARASNKGSITGRRFNNSTLSSLTNSPRYVLGDGKYGQGLFLNEDMVRVGDDGAVYDMYNLPSDENWNNPFLKQLIDRSAPAQQSEDGHIERDLGKRLSQAQAHGHKLDDRAGGEVSEHTETLAPARTPVEINNDQPDTEVELGGD